MDEKCKDIWGDARRILKGSRLRVKERSVNAFFSSWVGTGLMCSSRNVESIMNSNIILNQINIESHHFEHVWNHSIMLS